MENEKQITLRTDEETWKLFKKRCIDLDMTINDLVDKLFRKELGLPPKWNYEARKQPNEEAKT